MNNEEDGWFDASEDPDCPFIEHSDQKAQENVWILPWFLLDQVRF